MKSLYVNILILQIGIIIFLPPTSSCMDGRSISRDVLLSVERNHSNLMRCFNESCLLLREECKRKKKELKKQRCVYSMCIN